MFVWLQNDNDKLLRSFALLKNKTGSPQNVKKKSPHTKDNQVGHRTLRM